jgi:serine protease Do
VIGVTVAEAPRRGRIYTTAPETVTAALAASGRRPADFAAGEPITTDNYGRVADSLRRDLRVAQVVCLLA